MKHLSENALLYSNRLPALWTVALFLLESNYLQTIHFGTKFKIHISYCIKPHVAFWQIWSSKSFYTKLSSDTLAEVPTFQHFIISLNIYTTKKA